MLTLKVCLRLRIYPRWIEKSMYRRGTSDSRSPIKSLKTIRTKHMRNNKNTLPSKGVKTFIMQPGDLVLKKNARKVGRKGGAADPDWNGPYRIVQIDDKQRVALAAHGKDGRLLTTMVAYEHLKPFRESIDVKNNNIGVHQAVHGYNDGAVPVSGESSLKIQPDTQGAGNADKAVVSPLSLLAEAASIIGNNEKVNRLLCDSFANDVDDFVLGFPTKRKAACFDNDDVYFEHESGPKRRLAKPLPVIPAERQNQSIQEMQAILTAKAELSDLHIDHFSAMLREQFPHVGGLQRLGVFESLECQRVGTPTVRFEQVLYIGRHWVTVSNLHCSVAEVMVYDSLYTEIRKEHKHKFLKQLGWQLFTEASEMVVCLMDMQRQRRAVTCGLFALAYTYALCAGQRPEEICFQEDLMWSHLVRCLNVGKLSAFPMATSERNTKGILRKVRVHLFCVCRQPYDACMKTCVACRRLYHPDCLQLPERNPSDVFRCSDCHMT